MDNYPTTEQLRALLARAIELARPRCKTCRHWSRFSDDEFGALDGAGKCEKTPQLWDVAEQYDSGHWEPRMRLLPQHAGVLAAAEDGSGYSARLVTMPDFGCVQHEA